MRRRDELPATIAMLNSQLIQVELQIDRHRITQELRQRLSQIWHPQPASESSNISYSSLEEVG